MKRLPLIIIFFGAALVMRAAEFNLIPWPAKVEPQTGQFSLNEQTAIVTDTAFINEAALLADEIHLSRAVTTQENRILITAHGADKLNGEAYRLEVNQQGVTIRALSTAGAFYGCQTLRQLIEPGTREIPFVQIEDSPRYAWRGLMLDVSRHFFDEPTILQMLDWMADYKLNRLHLHLTDDQAWRLKIDKYPELTQTGARGDFSDPNSSPRFFTQAQMREIIAYAAQRHIVVVPEIDLPGHAGAATRTFPQLDGGAHTFNPAHPETYDFLQNVLVATMKIFPSPWIHIGGDEVNLTSWNHSPEVAEKLRAEGLKNTGQLEGYFVNRMAKFIKSHGRAPAGWDEIVTGKPEPGTIIFWWRHDKPEVLKQALAEGYQVVLTPRTPCYFDYPQDTNYPPNGWKLCNTPERVYAGPVIPPEIPAAQRKQILGVEGCLWTEHITTAAYLQFMTLPRLTALAEIDWTPNEHRNFTQFSQRLKPFLDQYRQLGIHFYDKNDPAGSLHEIDASKPRINLNETRVSRNN